MTTSLDRLKTQLYEVADLRHAGDLLEWDERVCMPDGGATVHGDMLATIRRLAHQKFTSSTVAELLESATADLDGAPPDDDGRRLVAVTARDYEKAVKVPEAFVAEHARVISAAQHVWARARANADFGTFRPHLERIVELKREYVSFFAAGAHPYDVLLDDFEPGMTTADVLALLSVLRPKQIALIQQLMSRQPVDDSCLRAPFAEGELSDFARDVATVFGFDWTRGRQDKSLHPFVKKAGEQTRSP